MRVEAGSLRSAPVGLPVGTVTGHLQLQDHSSLRSSFSLKCPICHQVGQCLSPSRKAVAFSQGGLGEEGGRARPRPHPSQGVHLAHVGRAFRRPVSASHPAAGRNVLVEARAEEPQTWGAH